MARRGTANSLSEEVYRKIRDSIISGSVQPGDRLQPALLSEQVLASTTVVREALAVLAGERLVTFRPGQGYFVPEIRRDLIRDLTSVRVHTESLALSWAMERGGLEWESELIAAHHRLTRTPRRTEDDHLNPEWSHFHRAFHASFINGCGVPVLIEVCDQLSAATEIYRAWSTNFVTTESRDVEAEHAGILESVLAGNRAEALERLASHYESTTRLIIENWPSPSAVE